jgi:hypothetical protein
VPAPVIPAVRPVSRPSNLVQIAGHFELPVRQQLDMLGTMQDRTSQDLLAEALNDLFVKYGHSALATVYGKGSRRKPRAK